MLIPITIFVSVSFQCSCVAKPSQNQSVHPPTDWERPWEVAPHPLRAGGWWLSSTSDVTKHGRRQRKMQLSHCDTTPAGRATMDNNRVRQNSRRQCCRDVRRETQKLPPGAGFV